MRRTGFTNLYVFLALSFAPMAANATVIGLDLEQFRTISLGYAAERQCRHLPAALHEELALHAAFAETAAARANGAVAVRDLRRYAKPPTTCGEATHSLVKAALSGGRAFERAFAAAEKSNTSQNRLSARQQRIRQRQQENRLRTAAFFSVRKNRSSGGSVDATSQLQRFQSQLHAYYVDHRCHFLPRKNAHRFWKMINNRHSIMSTGYAKPELAQINLAAKSAAKRVKCNRRDRRFVGDGLRALASDLAVN